jgi:putative PIN family toxin of toxin-antitoxin system
VRVVFDTNVLIAALIAHGTSAEVVEYALSTHEVVCGDFILQELREKLARKFQYPPERVRAVESFIRNHLTLVQAAALPHRVCRDPDDDNVLAVAKSAAADVVVTGDKDLLEIQEYEGVRIIPPAAFWEFERRRSKPPSR